MSAFFEEVGDLNANFRRKGRGPPTTVGVRIAECSIKISAVHCLVLSQSTRVMDRQTDIQTELRLPRPRWHSCVLRQKQDVYSHLYNRTARNCLVTGFNEITGKLNFTEISPSLN